jgi:nitrite reductase (NADH) small subunit/3-phenylpropionate/trans-cinnamate dioxygenase ferredoxin subunit
MSEIAFVDVGSTEEFPRGRGRAVDLCGTRVAVFRLDERWFAVQDACPHMGLSLADGRIEGNTVVCHGHDWCFDLASGKSDRRSGACARTFEVRVEGDRVHLRPPSAPAPAAEGDDEDDAWMRADPESFFKKK